VVACAAGIAVVILAGCSRSAQNYLDRGNAQLEQGNLNAAVLEFRNAVQKDPTFAPARLSLAETYIRQGNGAGALAEYVRAADLLPDDAGVQLKAGALLLAAGKTQDALVRADKVIARDPKDAKALTLRANALALLADLDGAIEQMQEAVTLGPSALGQANLGALQSEKGQLPEAEASFRKGVETDPRSIPARLALGQFLVKNGRREEAEDVFREAVAVDARDSTANRAMAAYYISANRAAEAEPFLKALADNSGDPAANLVLADYYAASRRDADAVAILEKLSASPSSWAVARSRMAAVQYAGGKRADAHRTIDEVIAKQSAYAPALVARGRFLLAEGKTSEALADAQLAVKAAPASPDGYYLLGLVRRAGRDADGAAAAFKEVLRLNPRSVPVQVQLAEIELQRGEFASSAQLAEQVLQRAPRSLEARLVLARSLLGQGELDRAGAVTGELVDAFPKTAAVHSLAGLVALRKNDRSGARTAYEKAFAMDPSLLEPLAALTELDISQGQGARATARVDARLRQTPNDSRVLVVAAKTWGATGDLAKAEGLLRRAIDADAANFEAYALLGQVYLREKRLDEALTQFDRLAAQRPGAEGPPTMAGLILEAQGKPEEARARYERLVEANPRAAVASNNLAWMYASRGEQLDRALKLAQAAVAVLPDDPSVNDTLAYVYLKKQLPALALPLLRLAVSKAPSHAAYYYHLGLAHMQAGDAASARQALQKALDLRADFDGAEDARKMLATLR
jgi:tetratricopeptide (TPR) repeat protein